MDPENDTLNIIKFVAKFAETEQKNKSNRAKSAFKQQAPFQKVTPLISWQPPPTAATTDHSIKNSTAIKKPPIKKNLQPISAWDKFTDEDDKLRYINAKSSCKNNIKQVDRIKLGEIVGKMQSKRDRNVAASCALTVNPMTNQSSCSSQGDMNKGAKNMIYSTHDSMMGQKINCQSFNNEARRPVTQDIMKVELIKDL